MVLALLGIAALLMAVNGTLGRVWADLRGVNGPDPGARPASGPGSGNVPQPGPAPSPMPQTGPAPSPGQPPAPLTELMAGMPGSGVRTNA